MKFYFIEHPRHFKSVFLNTQHVARLPRFRLLVKAHKSFNCGVNGGRASRPLVGLRKWATYQGIHCSGHTEQIALRVDEHNQPLCTALIDIKDLLRRICPRVEKYEVADNSVLIVYNFNALYTSMEWKHVHIAFCWWRDWYMALMHDQLESISPHEPHVMHVILQWLN